ncbi:MAG: 50S ribosomal protein L23 [Cytophagales bacterium]|uniref:Large ribosomal subunit protein uL23 n=1 Tax=Algoriphagus taiwanensis TaxID=1445656 RepID=A0ABQ6PVU1_9BACT|nr:MAG: 50S ribosomal protein L23 [Cytophagales bacterium]GMQ26214.1 50S ribosomal protein L23 [Algoriphagus sp. oki45]GMQ32072.1 50S ribosomal protein L23 [Algoriphagus taiwanensis]
MEILKQPLITEKISGLNEKGVYGFIVEKTADKLQIKNAVEKTYGVKVVSIRTMRYAAKHKTRYTKNRIVSGFTNSFKKAIVQVADGEVIDFYGEI